MRMTTRLTVTTPAIVPRTMVTMTAVDIDAFEDVLEGVAVGVMVPGSRIPSEGSWIYVPAAVEGEGDGGGIWRFSRAAGGVCVGCWVDDERIRAWLLVAVVVGPGVVVDLHGLP